MKKIARLFLKAIRIFISITGLFALIMIALSFTDYPYFAYHWTGNKTISQTNIPAYIIVMGAGGIPSEQGLIRCYFAAELAKQYPNSKLIVALPADSIDFETSDHSRMIDELMVRGVHKQRIFSETKGSSTYTQARNIAQMIPVTTPIQLVSSPVHLYRSIKTFEKVGFKSVSGKATVEQSFDESLLFLKNDKGKIAKSPDANPGFRYNMWSYLQYEIAVLREWAAIVWYKIRGYI
ncbi:MAG: YdcF family protein [Bacteroidales bacterium]|nr:YdcF family protein [Bacteroidales bacterium]